jgi:hypothetical protein
MSKAVKVSDRLYIVRGTKASGDIGVNFEQSYDAGYAGSETSNVMDKHIPIGKGDRLLHDLHKLASDNPTKWALLKTKRDFIMGQGVQVKTKERKNGKDDFVLQNDPETIQIEDFLEDIEYHENLLKKAIDYVFTGRYYILLKLNLSGKVESYERIDTFFCRPIQMQKGESKIMKYALNPNFGTRRFRPDESIPVPAYDSTNPTAYPLCIIDVKETYPGQIYHPFGEWWGTKESTEVSNKIPKFHNSGLDNGYNIKYHISIPDDYFKKDVYPDGMDEEKLKQTVLDEIGDSLSGIENVDKVIYTFHKVFTEGRFGESGIKITPMENPMSDDAYTKLLDSMNKVQASGHRVLPALAGIDTGGKLGGSGKELEAAANFQQGFLTHADRFLLTKDFYIIKKIMGWDRDKHLKFEDIRLYTFDVTPAGAVENKTSNPDPEEPEEEEETDETPKTNTKPKPKKDATDKG